MQTGVPGLVVVMYSPMVAFCGARTGSRLCRPAGHREVRPEACISKQSCLIFSPFRKASSTSFIWTSNPQRSHGAQAFDGWAPGGG